MVYQCHLENLGPFRERLTPTHEKRQKGTPEDVGVSDCKTDNGEKARMHERNTYANAMHMMTRYEMHDTQTNDKAATVNNWKTLGATVSGRYTCIPDINTLVKTIY